MTRWNALLCFGLAASSLACGGGAAETIPLVPQSPADPTSPPAAPLTAALGDIARHDGLEESALALWTLHLDPATLSATLTPKVARAAQQTDDIYDLSIENLMQPDSFRIVGVDTDGDYVYVVYQFTHPFPAPTDPTAPATAANRADLGIAGRVVFLTDTRGSQQFEFFTGDGDVVLFPGLLEDADGYMQPRGLLTLSGFEANAFPYYTLVDETPSSSNRVDPPSAGTARGNHNSVTGWQREDFGAGNNGFTGYGILHQGQTIEQRIQIDGATLEEYGETSIDVAIFAKYTDPRGGTTLAEKKANRLPASPASTAKFVYREPHGALDAESIRIVGLDGWIAPNDPTSEIVPGIHIVDWDARATETGEANLADDGNASRVAIEANGAPLLEFCIPGILGSSSTVVTWNTATALLDDDSAVPGGDAAQDSGIPGDALFYADSLTNAFSTGQARGTYWGVVRATDPEDALVAGDRFTLDPNLQPVTVNRPRIETYQAFRVATLSLPPTMDVEVVDPTVDSATSAALQVTSYTDPHDDGIHVEIDWNDDGNYEDLRFISPGDPNPIWVAPAPLNSTSTSDSLRDINLRFGVLPILTFYTPSPTFTLGPNRPPQITGAVALLDSSLASPALFQVRQNGATATDPEGDPVSYRVTNTQNGDIVKSNSFPIAATFTALVTVGSVIFTVRAIDPLHPGSGGTAYPTIPAQVLQSGWANKLSFDGPVDCRATIANDDCICVVGSFSGHADFGGGGIPAPPTSDMFIVVFNTDGTYRWSKTFGDLNPAALSGCAFTPSGDIVVGGNYPGSIDFGGGPLTPTLPHIAGVIVQFRASDGLWQGNALLPVAVSGHSFVDSLAVDSSGAIYIGGRFFVATDFGGGSRSPVGGSDAIVIKRPTINTYAWDHVFSGAGNFEFVASLGTSPTGPVYAGLTVPGSCDFGFGTRTPTASIQAAVVKLSGADGDSLWERVLDGGSCQGVAVDGAGSNVVGTGDFGQTASLDFGGGARTGAGGWVAKWSSGNVHVWDRRYTGSGLNRGYQVAVGPDGAVTVAGGYTGTQNFGGGDVRTSYNSTLDPFLVHLSSAGAYRWDRTYGTPFDNSAFTVAADGLDGVAAVGSFSGLVDFDPGTPEFFMQDQFGSDLFVTRLLAETGTWN